tara:strand:+ start:2577 stop:2747 length:171 start_codon:yes stop_codon:yes gene_type:complete
MNDIIQDIEVLQNAIIAFTEGASDEKRAALHSLSVLVAQKQHILDTFEKEMAPKTA